MFDPYRYTTLTPATAYALHKLIESFPRPAASKAAPHQEAPMSQDRFSPGTFAANNSLGLMAALLKELKEDGAAHLPNITFFSDGSGEVREGTRMRANFSTFDGLTQALNKAFPLPESETRMKLTFADGTTKIISGAVKAEAL